MRRIVYYVATSLDGYISGPEEDISGFAQGGAGVEQYLQDLKSFDTVIMGRKTYEFGYKYGLTPGQPAYPHMEHYIFSDTLEFSDSHPKVHVCQPGIEKIHEIRNSEGSDIYLCGGGVFARWLLENEQIDVLKLKLNPFIQGDGTALFAGSTKQYQARLRDQNNYPEGLLILEYDIEY